MMINFIAISVGLTCLIIFIDYLRRILRISAEFSRKITHTSVGLLSLFLPYFLSRYEIALMSLIFIVLLSFSKKMNILGLHKVERKTWGEVFFPLSIGIMALITLPVNVKAYNVGILCLSLSDTTANIMGGLFPVKKILIGKQNKSIGGSIGFFLVTLSIFLIAFLPEGNFYLILTAALVLSICELYSLFGIDNLVIPILAALFTTYLF